MFQTNESIVLVNLNICNYPVRLKKFGIVISPYLWNTQINKQLYLDNNICWHLFWIVVHFLPTLEHTLSGPFLSKVFLFSISGYVAWFPIYKFKAFHPSQIKGRYLHNTIWLYYFIEFLKGNYWVR